MSITKQAENNLCHKQDCGRHEVVYVLEADDTEFQLCKDHFEEWKALNPEPVDI